MYIYPFSRDHKVEVTYQDGSTETVSWEGNSKKLGELTGTHWIDGDGRVYLQYYFSKNSSASTNVYVDTVSLKDVRNEIPEAKLGETIEVERNFNNHNTFKITASQTSSYQIELDGTLIPGSDETPDILIEDANGEFDRRILEDGLLQINKGETAYVFAGPYDGDGVSVKVSQKNQISDISLENPEDIPTLYAEFLQCFDSDEDMESQMKAYLKDAKFKVGFSDGSFKTIKLGQELDEYGELCIESVGNYDKEKEQYVISSGPCNIGLCFKKDYDVPYYNSESIKLNVVTLQNSGNILKGLSNSNNSPKTYEFPKDGNVKYFYVENTLDKSQALDLRFVNHTEDAEDVLAVAICNDGEWSCKKLSIDSYPDDNHGEISVALSPGERMYVGYFGDATSVDLITNDIEIKEVQLQSDSRQYLKGAHLSDWLRNLYFEVTYEVDGHEYGELLSPDGTDSNVHNLSIEVLFDDQSADEVSAGIHTIKYRISQISSEYVSAGEIEVLSSEELFGSGKDVGTTVEFDTTKTYRGTNYAGFNLLTGGCYKVSLKPADNYKADDYLFEATDASGDNRLSEYSVTGFAGRYYYFDKGLLMIFAKGASDVTVSAVTSDDLENLCEECENLNSEDYTEDSWEMLSDALENAKQFLEDNKNPNEYYASGLAYCMDELVYAKNNLEIEVHHIDLSKNPQFVWETVRKTEIDDTGTITVGQYKVKAIFKCLDNPKHTVTKECEVVPGTINGTDGRCSVYYKATVTVEDKEFTDTKTVLIRDAIIKDDKKNSISTEVNTEPNVPETTITGLDKNLIEGLLSDDEKNQYENSKTQVEIKITTKVTNIAIGDPEHVPNDVSAAIEELRKIIKNTSGTLISKGINCIDLSLFKDIKINGIPNQQVPIKNTQEEITVELNLSEEQKNVDSGFNRYFYVIRVHKNEDGSLETKRLNTERIGDKLRFKTDKFSTYAIAYADVKAYTPSYPSYPVTDVTISQDKSTLTKEGETLQLTATVAPSYADNKTVTWKSSDEKVATVDKNGKVTAVANGTATITATSADEKHTATVTVTVKIAPEKLTLAADKKMLTKIGDSLQITAKVAPVNAYDKLIWKSSDEKIVAVDSNGKVTAAGNGEAIITATTEDGKISESVKITVKIADEPAVNKTTGYGRLKARSVTQTNNSIKVEWSKVSGADGYIVYGSRCNVNGKVYKYKKLATITNGKTRTWTHTKLKKATYYKYIVKAYKLVDGKKVITDTSVSVHAVTKGGKYGVAKAVSITKIGNKKNATEVTLKKGKTAQITAVEIKKDKKIKHHRNLCYESSNTKVATVTSDGVIKVTGKGNCTIWVYAQNGVYKAITVTVK